MGLDPLSLVGDLGGSVIEGVGSLFTNASNQRLAREQMAFQERMSSTAHQREVEDLKKAGLNPVLSAMGGGSSSPGGSMPTMQNPAAGIGRSIAGAVDHQIRLLEVANETKDTATRAKQADTDAARAAAQIANLGAQTVTEGARPGLLAAQAFSARSGGEASLSSAALNERMRDLQDVIELVKKGEIRLQDARVQEALQGVKTAAAQADYYVSSARGIDAARARDKALQPLYEIGGKATSSINGLIGDLVEGLHKAKNDPKGFLSGIGGSASPAGQVRAWLTGRPGRQSQDGVQSGGANSARSFGGSW